MSEKHNQENPLQKINIQLAHDIRNLFFRPEDREDVVDLLNPSLISLAYMARHKETDEELYIEFLTTHLANKMKFPIMQYPAYRILRQEIGTGIWLPTQVGDLPPNVIDSQGNEFFISTEYYLNEQGQRIRYEHIEQFDEEPLEDSNVPHFGFPLSKNDSRFIPMNGADQLLIRNLLTAFTNGEFKPGDYSYNSHL